MSVEKSSRTLISNVVDKVKMREFQSATLNVLKNVLINSFGPLGSNTIIKQEKALTKYSKDGHTILQSVQFQDIIENTVKQDLEDITRNVVKTVGDGTTSAVILSSLIFEELKKMEETDTPYEIIRSFKSCVKEIQDEILSQKQEFDPDIAYDIAYISTNGNEEVSENIRQIYKEFGNEVFIDVAPSVNKESYLKTYDGMTLETGYSDTAYINNKKKGCCTLRNARVYTFQDPIDTPEMGSMLDTIINNNIMSAYTGQGAKPIPTVIMTPKISRDMSSYIEKVVEFLYKFKDENLENKPPLLIISNIHHVAQYVDIARMCGAKLIKKYIDPKQQEIDIQSGLAPTPETIVEFGGQADIVESDVSKTKFVNPKNMHDENGEPSIEFKTLVEFLEAELQKAYENGEDNNVTGNLKRRINSLKANMVEYIVGGISASDRDVVRDLVEDAVLNCRSAARYGVGFGANFEGFRAVKKLKDKNEMFGILFRAYTRLLAALYSTAFKEDKVDEILDALISDKETAPYNIKTKEFDNKVLCSIYVDVAVLESISQIISLMFTSNQFICPSIQHNRYLIMQ